MEQLCAHFAGRADVAIRAGATTLTGILAIPEGRRVGLVVVVLRSAESRHGRSNRRLAQLLNERGLGTVLLDVLTTDEQWADDLDPCRVLGTARLAERLAAATAALASRPALAGLHVGYLARGSATPVALRAAAQLGGAVTAVVVRSVCLPELSEPLGAPTLVVPANDVESLDALADATARWMLGNAPARPSRAAEGAAGGRAAAGGG